MIIKSKSRKSASFAQLYDYINRYGGEPFAIFRNFLAFEPDRDHIVGEFERNAARLPARRNGNVLYHEILSLKRHPSVRVETQKEILYDLATRYLERRAERLLAYGRVHEEAEHLHFHFIISANELGKTSRFRLSRADFGQVQRDVERHLLTEYPQMEDKPLYNDARERRLGRKQKPEKDAEYQVKKRTGKPTKKEAAREALREALATATTTPQLIDKLAGQGITLEERGKAIVAVQGKNRYRLTALGLQDAYTLWKASQREMDTRREEMASLRAKQAAKREKEVEKERGRGGER